MLELGLACSHSPNMFVPPAEWDQIYEFLVRGVPRTTQAEAETPEVSEGYWRRINGAFDVLGSVLEESHLDVLVMVGGDQREVFHPDSTPTLAMYVGDEPISGSDSIVLVGQSLLDNHLTLASASDLAGYLAGGLVEMGFDLLPMHRLECAGNPEGGLGHAFTRPARVLHVDTRPLPVVIVLLNNQFPPLPSAQRCYDLGKALAQLLNQREERSGLLGSGGLSHDPLGPRSGWIDEPLDRWVLSRISGGRSEELTRLFGFDSDTLRGGTGEIRSWITVAGAFEHTPATVVDYIPAYRACTGLGFAYWK